MDNNQFLRLSHKPLKWLIALAGGLLVLSIVLFFYGGSAFSESKVSVDLAGPSQASAGDEAVYKISYQNNTKTELHDIHLVFEYPKDSVVIKDANISGSAAENIDIAFLKPGEKGEDEFHAFLVGDRGNIKIAKLRFAYQAGTLKSLFEKNQEVSTTITAVPISLTLVAPPNTISGQQVNYLLDYRNQSDGPVSDIQFVWTYPDGFTPQKFSKNPSQGNNIWSVSRLNKSEGARIMVQGTLRGNQGESKPVTVAVKRKVGDKYIDYEKVTTTTAIVNPLLKLNLSVNGSRDYSAHPADSLDYTVNYENNSTYNFSGLTLTVSLAGTMWDSSSLNTNGGYYDSSANTISWNASEVNDFGNLTPNTKGLVKFSVRVKSSFPAGGAGASNLYLKTSAKLSTPNVPAGFDGNEVSAEDSLNVKVTTQPTFRQSAYYSDSAFGSAGPFPPQAGKETVFTIHWQITNPGNDLSNAKISASLPSGVTWKNAVSVGAGQPDVVYNRNGSEVVWNLDSIPQGVGVTASRYEAVFQVSIKPSLAQKGAPISLLKSARLSAVDTITQQAIIVGASDLTTNNLTDQPENGSVQ